MLAEGTYLFYLDTISMIGLTQEAHCRTYHQQAFISSGFLGLILYPRLTFQELFISVCVNLD